MITVKLYGLLRLDTGLQQVQTEAATARDLRPAILREFQRLCPAANIKKRDLDGCVLMVNGTTPKPNTPLSETDEVLLFPPVCGG